MGSAQPGRVMVAASIYLPLPDKSALRFDQHTIWKGQPMGRLVGTMSLELLPVRLAHRISLATFVAVVLFTLQVLQAAGPTAHPGISKEPVISWTRLPVMQPGNSQSARVPQLAPFQPPFAAGLSFGASTLAGLDKTILKPIDSASLPRTSATNSSVPVSPPLGTNFRGVDDTARYVTPAGPGIAVGPRHVVQVVNCLIRITDKSGGSPITVDAVQMIAAFLKNNPYASAPSWPHVIFDHFANRFVIVWNVDESFAGKGFYLLQISDTADPTLGWKLFFMRSEMVGNVDTDAPAEDVQIGFDDTNFYLTNNFYPVQDFHNTKIRVMGKAQFYNARPTAKNPNVPIEFVDFVDMLDGKQMRPQFIRPCVTFGKPGREYFVSAPRGSPYGDGDYITLYSISGTWPNANKVLPVYNMEGAVSFSPWFWYYSSSYYYQVDYWGSWVAQPVASNTISPVYFGEDYLQNAVYRNGVVYTTHSVLTSTDGVASSIGVKAINVSSKTRVLDQVIGEPHDAHYYCPAVTVDANNTVYTVFNRSFESIFIESRYAVKTRADANFRASSLLKKGDSIDLEWNSGTDDWLTAWGPTSGIAIDPAKGSVWMNSMYATNNLYGTWVGNLTSLTAGPSEITAAFDQGSRTLSILGDAGDNQFSVTFTKATGTLTITASNKNTQINGKASEVFSGIDGSQPINVQADLGSGNDNSQWPAIPDATWNVDLGDGNDNITVTNSTGTTVNLDGGPGIDVQAVLLSKFGQSQVVGFP